MAWIMGIGIGLFLLFSFPRQMGLLLLVVVGAGVALYLFVSESERRGAASRARELGTVDATARGDAAVCADPNYPVVVSFVNRSPDRTLNAISFDLKAYKPGYSDAVLSSYSLRSDRILRPGEGYLACWSKPYGTIPAGYSPQTLSWVIEKNYLNWQ